MSKLILYHADCMDGACAAYIARTYMPDAEAHEVRYNEPPPDVTGKNVYIVDFSYPAQTMLQMFKSAASLTIFDHHRTAENACKLLKAAGAYVVFDINRSGAGITWDVLFGGTRPAFVDYVQDRDLWKYELPHSREVNAAMRSYFPIPESFELIRHKTLQELIDAGEVLLRHENMQVLQLLKTANTRYIGRSAYTTLVVNTQMLISEVGHELAKKSGTGFGATYYEDLKRRMRIWSLRSLGTVDVGEIAKELGGGGHKAAAGFSEDL